MTFSLFGLTFHLYGLILAAAGGVGLMLVDKQARLHNVSKTFFERVVIAALLGAVVGARVWHVVTDFYLYKNNFLDIFKIWQGGLSVVGALAGGVLGMWIVLRQQEESKNNLWLWTDLAVFGLPFTQALGRWANFVNQELYGLPSKLPWAISINPEFRVAGFESFERFHPLFFYESILMLLFGLWVWFARSVVKNEKSVAGHSVGSGWLSRSYVLYYALVRFFLDFIRLPREPVFGTGLGANQLVFLVVIVGVILAGRRKQHSSH